MNTISKVVPQGKLSIKVRDENGHEVSSYEGSNLVVNKGRNTLLKMLTGDQTSRIYSVELGTGGTTGDPWTPAIPSANDVALVSPTTPVSEKLVAGYSYADAAMPVAVDFSVVFESYEVDDIVSEAVLKFDDGTVYARFTFPSVYLKVDKGYSMEIIWTVTFS